MTAAMLDGRNNKIFFTWEWTQSDISQIRFSDHETMAPSQVWTW
jgi:hypothetical protein